MIRRVVDFALNNRFLVLAFALLRRSVSMEVNPVRWHRTLLMLSAVLGVVLNNDAEVRNEGSELLDLNV